MATPPVTTIDATDGNAPLRPNASTGRLGDRLFGGAAAGASIGIVALVVLIGTFLVATAVPALRRNEANFLTSTEWITRGDHPRFGILAPLWTTVSTSLIALVVAVPLGVGVALFLTEYAPPWLKGPGKTLIDLLAAVPSIVYGLWGWIIAGPLFVPVQNWLQKVLGWFPLFSPTGIQSASTIAFAGLVLAIMILPIITSLSRDVFAATPVAHKEGALALGATQWEMIRTAVLPFGKPGMVAASMLGLGRALGETVAVMMILSQVAPDAAWNWSLFNGGQTFASMIASASGEFDSPQNTGAYIAAGLVLFVLTFVVNAIARIVINRRKAFTE